MTSADLNFPGSHRSAVAVNEKERKTLRNTAALPRPSTNNNDTMRC